MRIRTAAAGIAVLAIAGADAPAQAASPRKTNENSARTA